MDFGRFFAFTGIERDPANLSFVKSFTIKHCMSIHILKNNTSMVILSDYDGITSTFKIVFHQVSH